ISNTSSYKIVYTTDGTAPTVHSAVYTSPIPMPLGGVLQSASVTSSGQLGIAASKSFAGLAPIGWKVVDVDSEETSLGNNAAANAIDGNPSTIWQTRSNAGLALPHHLTVDMGSSHRIAGLVYLPRQDGNLDGVVEIYRFETSMDGRRWTSNVAS